MRFSTKPGGKPKKTDEPEIVEAIPLDIDNLDDIDPDLDPHYSTHMQGMGVSMQHKKSLQEASFEVPDVVLPGEEESGTKDSSSTPFDDDYFAKDGKSLFQSLNLYIIPSHEKRRTRTHLGPV
jgi:hypothetical protein